MRIVLLVAALSVVDPAFAQQTVAMPPSDPDNEITVTGKIDHRIATFVDTLSEVQTNDPIARFVDGRFCPGVVGLGDAHDTAIAARMRRVATAAGIRIAPEGCKTSALVIFTTDKQKMVVALERRYPNYFLSTTSDPLRTARNADPAIAWHVGVRVDRNGRIVGELSWGRGTAVVSSYEPPSRIHAMSRPVIGASVVVIDVNAVVGFTPTQVADYALMRALTEADPKSLAGKKIPTILTMLDTPLGSPAPVTLTRWDLSYLKARYTGDPYYYGRRQNRHIQGQLKKDLTEKPPSE